MSSPRTTTDAGMSALVKKGFDNDLNEVDRHRVCCAELSSFNVEKTHQALVKAVSAVGPFMGQDDPDSQLSATLVQGSRVHHFHYGNVHCLLLTISQKGAVSVELFNQSKKVDSHIGVLQAQRAGETLEETTREIKPEDGEQVFVLMMSKEMANPVRQRTGSLFSYDHLLSQGEGIEIVPIFLQNHLAKIKQGGRSVTEADIVSPYAGDAKVSSVPFTVLAMEVKPENNHVRLAAVAEGIRGVAVAEALTQALSTQLEVAYGADQVQHLVVAPVLPPMASVAVAPAFAPAGGKSSAYAAGGGTLFSSKKSVDTVDFSVFEQDYHMADEVTKKRYAEAVSAIIQKIMMNEKMVDDNSARLLRMVLVSMNKQDRSELVQSVNALMNGDEAKKLFSIFVPVNYDFFKSIELYSSGSHSRLVTETANLVKTIRKQMAYINSPEAKILTDSSGKRQEMQREIDENIKLLTMVLQGLSHGERKRFVKDNLMPVILDDRDAGLLVTKISQSIGRFERTPKIDKIIKQAGVAENSVFAGRKIDPPGDKQIEIKKQAEYAKADYELWTEAFPAPKSHQKFKQ